MGPGGWWAKGDGGPRAWKVQDEGREVSKEDAKRGDKGGWVKGRGLGKRERVDRKVDEGQRGGRQKRWDKGGRARGRESF